MSTSGSGEMDITSREVLEELMCPVCVEYMTPPIPMCQNGHNICNTCRQKVNQCPFCTEQFWQSSCWSLENIIEKIKFRCQYYTEGCAFISTAPYIKAHEDGCPDRPFKCPFSVVGTTNFYWRGHISGMWSHILDEHGPLAVPGKCQFFLTVDSAGPGALHRALSTWGETFFLVFRVINMDLYCCVLYVGPQERASLYKYWVVLATKDRSGFATECLPTRSYFVGVETLFRNQECAVFSCAFWNRCLRLPSRNTVSFEVQICR
jgi:E3 ubiquitin-protein ligase SIAH1